MLDIQKLSGRYSVRLMEDADADQILELCLGNAQYYEYCEKRPSRRLILQDLHATPPHTDKSSKYYVGFYDQGELAAVMDLIDGYPDSGSAFIGFFMMNQRLQGNGIGSEIVRAVRLGIDRDNPQSTHFWKKNGFLVVDEVAQNGGTILVAEKTLV